MSIRKRSQVSKNLQQSMSPRIEANMRNIRARIERLEAREPGDIILKLRDGTNFHYHGPSLSFVKEALQDRREKRSTPLLEAILQTVSAQGSDIWQVLQVMARMRMTEQTE